MKTLAQKLLQLAEIGPQSVAVRLLFNQKPEVVISYSRLIQGSAGYLAALQEAGNYDPDYLLEDFDITIKLLKSHQILHGSNEAVCYTEAPETLQDIYRQRLSWFRGDFQNFWKHRRIVI